LKQQRAFCYINTTPFLVKQGFSSFFAIFDENDFRVMKVFSLKNSVVFLQIAIAFCAVYHYHKNVLSEMS